MKHIHIILLLLIATASLFANTSGEVMAIKGKVEVQKDGQWRPAQKGGLLDS